MYTVQCILYGIQCTSYACNALHHICVYTDITHVHCNNHISYWITTTIIVLWYIHLIDNFVYMRNRTTFIAVIVITVVVISRRHIQCLRHGRRNCRHNCCRHVKHVYFMYNQVLLLIYFIFKKCINLINKYYFPLCGKWYVHGVYDVL